MMLTALALRVENGKYQPIEGVEPRVEGFHVVETIAGQRC